MAGRYSTITVERNCIDCKFRHESVFGTDETERTINFCENGHSIYSEKPVMNEDTCKYFQYKGRF